MRVPLAGGMVVQMSMLVRSLPLLALGLLQAGPAGSQAGQNGSGEAAAARRPAYGDAFANHIAIDQGTAALVQDLRRLRTRASLMMIVAHPDDEDGGMLAYESREVGADTSLLTLNRGEGGQNLMSADFWDQLGQVRTQELLSAGQFYGVHQYFTRVADFGFSKTLAESLALWGHDRVLYDCVRAVRIARPLVVSSVFAGNVSDGHGQHQVSGLMAQEVYTMAGDPTVFPDQIRAGLLPWSPLKVYARVPFARVTDRGIYDYATGHWEPVRFQNYVTGESIDGVPKATVQIPEGTYEPLFGRSYLAVGREGLGQQKSQNGGVGEPGRGPFASPYHLYASRVGGPPPDAESGLFEGVDVSLEGIASYAPETARAGWRERLKQVEASVAEATAALDAEHPEKTAPALARGLGQTEAMLAALDGSSLPAEARGNMRHELEVKRTQFNQALLKALGVSVQAVVTAGGTDARAGVPPGLGSGQATAPAVIAGEPLTVSLRIANQGAAVMALASAELTPAAGGSWQIAVAKGEPQGDLAPRTVRDVVFQTTVPADAPLTQPYFARPTLEQAYYDVLQPGYLNEPEMHYPLTAEVHLRYAGQDLRALGVVQTVQPLLGPGPTPQPLLVAPAISVGIAPKAGVLPLSSRSLPVSVTVHSSVQGEAAGQVRLELPEGWTAEPKVAPFAMTGVGEDQALRFLVTPTRVGARPYTITAVAAFGGHDYREGFQMVGYKGLRPYPYFQPATYRTTGTDVTVAPGLRIGYVMGTGDAVPESLQDLGIHVASLSAQDLASADLGMYDAIVLGIRAYAARPELAQVNQRLLEYTRRGGVVIVQYQTPEYDHNFGPYPLTLSSDPEKVVEEDGEVSLPLPGDPLLNWPNHITRADFNGWVEERGHGFLRSWDPHYVTPTEMHDAGQDPQRGGLVYARYGKGVYVYVSFAFFREMPEGVPGAFRLMANLLSLGKNPALRQAAAGQP